MAYSIFKLAHLCLVVAFFCIHFLKGLWLIDETPKSEGRSRLAKLYPYLITLLIASGLWLSTEPGKHSIQSPWVIATIVHSAIFVGLTLIAFRFGPTKTVRVVAWFASVLALFQIAVTDMTGDPLGIIALPKLVYSLAS